MSCNRFHLKKIYINGSQVNCSFSLIVSSHLQHFYNSSIRAIEHITFMRDIKNRIEVIKGLIRLELIWINIVSKKERSKFNHKIQKFLVEMIETTEFCYPMKTNKFIASAHGRQSHQHRTLWTTTWQSPYGYPNSIDKYKPTAWTFYLRLTQTG